MTEDLGAARGRLDRRRFLGLALGAAAAGPLLAACGGASDRSSVERRHRDGILRVGVAAAPGNINPLDSGSEVTRWLAEPVMESLYTYDEQLRSVPLLAAGEPEVSADALRWTIPLRRGIKFHNGEELVADDVVATLGHLLNLGSGSEWITYLIDYVQSFEAVDSHTVGIELARPYGLLRSHLTNLPISHRSATDRRDAMVGTGPYRLVGYTAGQSFRTVRFDDYHGKAPSFAGIEFSVFADGATRLVSLRQGKVDLITAVPYQNLDTVKSDADLRLVLADAPIDLLSYPMLREGPFADDDFRLAVAMSMDRAGVRDRVYGGHAVIGQGPIGPAERGWDASVNVFPAEPDLDEAERLLRSAGTKTRSFTLTTGTSQTAKEVAAVLAAGWARVGLKVAIEQLPGGQWSSRWLSNDYELLMNTFQSGFTAGPANYMTLAPAHSQSLLSSGYRDPEVDAWMDTVWQTNDEQERDEALRLLNRRLAERAVMIPPVYPRLAMGQRRELSAVDEATLRISRVTPQNLRFVSR